MLIMQDLYKVKNTDALLVCSPTLCTESSHNIVKNTEACRLAHGFTSCFVRLIDRSLFSDTAGAY